MKRQYVSIGEVTRWISGGTPNRSVAKYWMGSIPWISASTLKPNEIHKSDQHLTPEAVAVGSMMAPIGATLLLVRGSALYKEIRAGTVVSPVCFNQDVKALIPDSRIIPKFLTYSILGRATDLLKLVSTAGNSAGVLDTKLVQSLDILLPSEPEQRAIAGALSDVDSLLESLDALIAKKRAIKQATMQQLLTGETRLPGFSKKWKKWRLSDLGSFAKGRGIKREDISDNGLPCIRYGELYTRYTDSIFNPISRIPPVVASQSLPIEKGDLLFAGSGESAEEIGKCAAYLGECPAYAGGDIIVYTPVGQNSMYLSHLMNHSTVAKQKSRMGQGDAVVHISARNLAQLRVELPHLPEQTAIATVLSDMDSEVTTLEQRRDKTHAIKQAMLQQLLTGRIRLV